MQPYFFLFVGLALGGVIGWLLNGRRQTPHDTRLEEELRQQLVQREADLNKHREAHAQTATTIADASARREAAERLLLDQRAAHERQIVEAKVAQEKALADLRDTFKALSADALRQTQPEFLRLATETLGRFTTEAKGDLDTRRESIAKLVKPLEDQLQSYQQRLQQSETNQSTMLGEVKKQLELLGKSSLVLANETQQFRSVLKSNQARGRWGEETLRNVIESAGLSQHCDFVEQSAGDDGRPDLLIKLPGHRVIIVDSKVPDLDSLGAMDGADSTKRAEICAAHAARLKLTMRSLSEREYPRQFPNAFDHVVLFLPAESLYSAALEGDRDLHIEASRRHIVLATPSTLIALLNSVKLSWQQHAQAENARAIAEAAQELFARVATFSAHFEKIRTGLERATEAYNCAVGSYEKSVRPQGERLKQLGAGMAGKELAEPPPLSDILRTPPGA
ncbi:MAG: DNA recombination protein RmuC [Pedosphaera sp.]|nr:DNA recombination protein RmuC [Pedosphaera sp.]MST00330.1 DNA recombination protein RmuC [Pedosphaera sp.]